MTVVQISAMIDTFVYGCAVMLVFGAVYLTS